MISFLSLLAIGNNNVSKYIINMWILGGFFDTLYIRYVNIIYLCFVNFASSLRLEINLKPLFLWMVCLNPFQLVHAQSKLDTYFLHSFYLIISYRENAVICPIILWQQI